MAKKRSNNEGTLYEDKEKGGYRVQLTAPDGKRISKRFKDSGEAVKWKNDKLSEFGKGQYVAPTKMTVKMWRTQWLEEYILPKRRTKTYEDYKALLNNHLLTIDEVPMQEVLPYHITKIYNAMRKKKLAESTILKLHSILHNLFKQARISRLILINPIEDIERPKAVRPDIVTIDEKEMQLFLNAAKGTRIYTGIYLLAHTAMRLGEILGIRWSDINFKEKTLTVAQSIQRTKANKLSAELPKTENSVRTIYLDDNILDVLKEARQRQIGDDDLKHSKYVTCNNKGTALEPRRFAKEFDEIRAKTGIDTTRHGLRHSVASILIDKNVAIPEVAALLGHADQAFTYRTYVHPRKDATKKASSVISRALNTKKAKPRKPAQDKDKKPDK
ncbi:tyrosine-type recombinase/integrase [Pelosinus propionicus]|uniref:Site-specific recombinase XerD n=1 Tax=Pelosinus propionicus DSM 13327 TaxID=1123291 RepID=A0A1I4QAR6_9FIRM|nr:site-specific integrase [Pelosinus propionicus]SFM37178.1 Site-specific recombinase XerD [Pelosinus propionicus DSM 13327]